MLSRPVYHLICCGISLKLVSLPAPSRLSLTKSWTTPNYCSRSRTLSSRYGDLLKIYNHYLVFKYSYNIFFFSKKWFRIVHHVDCKILLPLITQDLNGLNRHANLRKINDFAKRARIVKNHAIVISELSKKMPKVRLLVLV